MKHFRRIIILTVFAAAAVCLTRCNILANINNYAEKLTSDLSQKLSESPLMTQQIAGSNSVADPIEPPPIPESISDSFGPRTEPITEISIESGDDLMEQFIGVMNGRAQTVTVNMPSGTEEFYMNELKEQIERFTDITSLSTKWIQYSGVCTVDINYNDAALIMAYLEGKTASLSSEVQTVLDTAISIHDSLINSSMSDYDKIKAYHDYIINNTEYLNTGDRAHSVVGALIDGQCVCEGYTEAFDLLCYLSGIDCMEISGTGETDNSFGPHAWNKVCLDGNWYNVDVTWDDPVSSKPVLRYDYFLISDDKMAEDHEWYLYEHIPACPEDY